MIATVIRKLHRWEKYTSREVSFDIHSRYLGSYVHEGDYVLEIGAGAGRFTQVLASIGARIVVADISSGQLRLNREFAEELGFDRGVEARLHLDLVGANAIERRSLGYPVLLHPDKVVARVERRR